MSSIEELALQYAREEINHEDLLDASDEGVKRHLDGCYPGGWHMFYMEIWDQVVA